MTLENITGNLLQSYKQSTPGTIQCVDQLMNERRTKPELRNQCFYTADGEVYSVDNGRPTLRITRESVNPVLKNIDDAFTQLTQNHNYSVSQADFEAVKSAPDTVTIDLTKLTLQGNDKEWSYITIFTHKPSLMDKSYDKLNPEEQKLAQRVYGQGTDFVKNMKMLHNAGIKEIKIYVLNPTYVQEKATESPVGRASWLYNFNDDSNFYAVDRNIDTNNRLRGVRNNKGNKNDVRYKN